jgi:hypothetical protein
LPEEDELRPDAEPELFIVEVLVVERPEVPPLLFELLLLPAAVDLLPPEEDLLREALLLPAVVLLSVAEEPLEPELLPLLPDDVEDLEEVLPLVVPLPEDAVDLDAVLEAVPLFEDSLLELFSLGVPPVERFVAVLLFEAVEPPLPEVFWLEVFFVCA